MLSSSFLLDNFNTSCLRFLFCVEAEIVLPRQLSTLIPATNLKVWVLVTAICKFGDPELVIRRYMKVLQNRHQLCPPRPTEVLTCLTLLTTWGFGAERAFVLWFWICIDLFLKLQPFVGNKLPFSNFAQDFDPLSKEAVWPLHYRQTNGDKLLTSLSLIACGDSNKPIHIKSEDKQNLLQLLSLVLLLHVVNESWPPFSFRTACWKTICLKLPGKYGLWSE